MYGIQVVIFRGVKIRAMADYHGLCSLHLCCSFQISRSVLLTTSVFASVPGALSVSAVFHGCGPQRGSPEDETYLPAHIAPGVCTALFGTGTARPRAVLLPIPPPVLVIRLWRLWNSSVRRHSTLSHTMTWSHRSIGSGNKRSIGICPPRRRWHCFLWLNPSLRNRTHGHMHWLRTHPTTWLHGHHLRCKPWRHRHCTGMYVNVGAKRLIE